MPVTREQILDELRQVVLPGGDDIVSSGMVRAVTIDDGNVSFVLEVEAEQGPRMGPVREAARQVVGRLVGVDRVSVVLTSHQPSAAPDRGPRRICGSAATPRRDRRRRRCLA